MTRDELKNTYGPEYPTAVQRNGCRLPLTRETRFARVYASSDKETGTLILSRFMDRAEHDRMEFCQECEWLHEQSDYPDMLRFIAAHSSPSEFSAIALNIAAHLPQNESFPILLESLHLAEIGETSNILQAIAHTKHADALATLRAHFKKVWRHPHLNADDKWLNWVAFDATNCIQYMHELGAPSEEFAENVHPLSTHPCQGNRDTCRRWLAKYYSWLT